MDEDEDLPGLRGGGFCINKRLRESLAQRRAAFKSRSLARRDVMPPTGMRRASSSGRCVTLINSQLKARALSAVRTPVYAPI